MDLYEQGGAHVTHMQRVREGASPAAWDIARAGLFESAVLDVQGNPDDSPQAMVDLHSVVANNVSEAANCWDPNATNTTVREEACAGCVIAQLAILRAHHEGDAADDRAVALAAAIGSASNECKGQIVRTTELVKVEPATGLRHVLGVSGKRRDITVQTTECRNPAAKAAAAELVKLGMMGPEPENVWDAVPAVRQAHPDRPLQRDFVPPIADKVPMPEVSFSGDPGDVHVIGKQTLPAAADGPTH